MVAGLVAAEFPSSRGSTCARASIATAQMTSNIEPVARAWNLHRILINQYRSLTGRAGPSRTGFAQKLTYEKEPSPTFTCCKSDRCELMLRSQHRLPKLAAGGVDVVAAGVTGMGYDTCVAEDLGELRDPLRRRSLIRL